MKKRFPTLDHFVDAGLLLENELAIFQSLNAKFPKPSKHWLPIVWASSIVTRARKEGRIRDDFAVKTLIDELNKFRGHCGSLIHYDTISIPLVYTQVVTLAVYSYFITSVMGRQWIQKSTEETTVDYYFPVFTTLQFFFYMGWLKVAETLINPFGEDDDDFEVNWIVDRNLQVSHFFFFQILTSLQNYEDNFGKIFLTDKIINSSLRQVSIVVGVNYCLTYHKNIDSFL